MMMKLKKWLLTIRFLIWFRYKYRKELKYRIKRKWVKCYHCGTSYNFEPKQNICITCKALLR